MIICPNKNSKAFKSWLKAGISEEDIYTEFVMNNYALPVYSENLSKALTVPQIETQIKQHEELIKFGIKSIKDLRHSHVDAIGAFYKDTIYYGDRATTKTISEEIGHALLQKFTTPEAHDKVMLYGKELLTRRLKAEGRTLDKYLRDLQSDLKITKGESENYAYEEEFMKDFALYNSTGQNAEDLRNIQTLTDKFSFLGPLAESVAEFWYNLIKSIKSIFKKAPGQLELVKSLKANEAAKYSRGYSKPSYAFMKKGYSSDVSISPTAIQLFSNNVIATLQQEIQSNISYNDFLSKLERVTNTFRDLYSDETVKALDIEDLELLQSDNYTKARDTKIVELKKQKVLDYDSELFEDLANYGSVLEYNTVDEANTTSLRDQYIEQVRSSLKDLGKKIGQNRVSDDNDSDIYTDEDNQILETVGQQYDKSPNEFSPESLSFGLKNIILKTGKVISYDGFNLVIAPDEAHIYSGLVRFSANSFSPQTTFKNLVEFTKNPDNKSAQLFINDYFLENFTTKATYAGDELSSQEEWSNLILSDEFDISKLSFKDSTLAQEFIILLKSMSLVTRDQETMKLTISENTKKEKIVLFESFKTNLNDAKSRVYTEFNRNLINNFSNKFLVNPDKLDAFMKKAPGADHKFIQAMFYESGIYLNNFIADKIRDEVVSQNTYFQGIKNKVNLSVRNKEQVFSTKEDGKFNDLIRRVADLVVKYDENIVDNSFLNMENKSIYAYQRPTTILKTLNQLGNTLDNPNNQNNIWTNHLNNPIQKFFNGLSVEDKTKATKTFSLDGVFSQEVIRKENKKDEYKRLDEAAFSKMDGRVFGAVMLNQMLEKAEVIGGELMFPITLGQNEASNLVDFIKVPYQERKSALTTILKQEIDRHQAAISFMEDYFKGKEEQIKADGNKMVVTYDQLVANEASKPKGEAVPIYKGYLEGTYYFDLKDDKLSILPSSTSKALKVSRNLDGVITKADLYSDGKLVEEGPILDFVYETASKNYDNQLNKQYNTLKELGTVDLVDIQIKTGNLKGETVNKKTFQSKFLNVSGSSENMQRERVKNLLEQFWYGSTFTNQLLLNDPFIAFKNDLKDIAKRRRIYNAAINSVEIPFDVPSLGIKAKKDLTFMVFEDTVEKVFGKSMEVDDGQSYASLNFWLTKAFTKGRLNETKYNLWKRVQAGEAVDVKEVQDNDFYIAVQKTVGSEGHTAIKHAEYTILPIDVADINAVNTVPTGYSFQNGILLPNTKTVSDIYVGYKDGDTEVINKLGSRPDRKDLYDKYLIVNGFSINSEGGFDYRGPIDILTPETTQKGAKPNVISLDKYHANPDFYRQTISASNYGDQLEVPQGHDNIIDPTQNREVKINEYSSKDALKLVDDFIKNETDRNEFEVDLMMRSLYGKDYKTGLRTGNLKKDIKEFYENLQNILKDTGASQQLIDFAELDGNFARYNHNLPVIRQKFTQILFKMFTKALRHKVSGDTMVQVSKSGHNLIKKLEVNKGIVSWKAVTWEEYKQDQNKNESLEDLSKLTYDGRKHKGKQSTELTDKLLEISKNKENKNKNIYFVDEVRFMKPYYENGKFKFYTSETLMPRWYSESKDIDPNLKLQYAVRIPTADKQSSVVIEWVGQLAPEQGNAIIVPKEVISLSGSDFDIDKLFAQRFEGNFKEGKFVKYQNNFEDFLDYMFKTKTQTNFKLNKLKEEDKNYNSLINEREKLKNELILAKVKNKAKIDNHRQALRDSNVYLKESLDNLLQLGENKIANKIFDIYNINKQLSYLDREDSSFDDISNYLDLVEDKKKLLGDLYTTTGDAFYKGLQELDSNYINDLYEEINGVRQKVDNIKELIARVEKFLKLEVLKDLGYPTNQIDYAKENINYSGALNNEQLQRSIELLSQEEIIDVYLTPSSIETFTDTFNNFSYELSSGAQYFELLKQLNSKTNEFYIEVNGDTLKVFPFAMPTKNQDGKLTSKFLVDSDQYQQFTVNNFVKYQNDVKAGKESIGLVANANVLGIYAKRYNLELNNPIEFEGEKLTAIRFKTLKERRVFDAIASTISVVVDEAKESQLANHGISVEDLKVMSVLMLHGLDVEDAIAFVQSPGAVKYKDLINRSKIKLETEYKSNQEIVDTYINKNKNFNFADKEIKREELVKYTDTYDKNLESKYIKLYESFTGMYNELSETIPIVKIKAGMPTTVEEVEKYQEQINALVSEALKAPDKKMKHYNFDNFVKQKQVRDTMRIINVVNEVGRTELLEMQGIFSTVKTELKDTTTITSNKSDYGRKINELIDKFLLGQKVQKKKPQLLQRAQTIEQEIIDTIKLFSERLQTSTGDELKSYKDTLALVNRLVKVNDKTDKKSIIFATDGKLSARLQMQIANAWLNLKHSNPGSIESKFADNLFDYYFLKSGLHWNPGSLEPMFPASQYKEYSEMYEELLTEDTLDLKDKFYEYLFSTPEGTKYLKSVNSFKQISEDIKFDRNIGKFIAESPNTPIAVEIKGNEQNDFQTKVFLKVNNVYQELKQTIPTFVNPMLYNSEVETGQLRLNFTEQAQETPQTSTQTYSRTSYKIVSDDYGVVLAETNPTEAKTQEFVDIIQPQIQKQTYKENKGKFANEMFHFGLMWARVNQKAKPVKINAFEKSGYYAYHELDQNGNELPSLEILQPIITEIENTLSLDMSDYDSVIGNIYLDNQYVYPHKDTTESKSARNYPVIVYTIGNPAGLGIVDNNDGKMTFANQYNTQWLPNNDKLKGYTNELLTKNGSIYTFGLEGNGRFELTHSTPINNKKLKAFPPITLPNGQIITNYTITLTFRRAQDLTQGIPDIPKQLESEVTTQPVTSVEQPVKQVTDNIVKSIEEVKPTQEGNIKSGVQELFESSHELSSIGTQEQYSQYLDTIFPDSKVKDIVYHGTKTKFDKFDISKSGENLASWSETKKSINFTNVKNVAENYAEAFSTGENMLELIADDFNRNPERINADGTINKKEVEKQLLENNPNKIRRAFKTDENGDFILKDGSKQWEKERPFTNEEWNEIIDNASKRYQEDYNLLTNWSNNVISAVVNIKNPTLFDAKGKGKTEDFFNVLNNSKGDGFIANNLDDWGISNNIRVFEPEQIHILGSKQDLDGFKEFINKSKKPLEVRQGVQELFDTNPELSKIGNQQQYSQYLDTIFPDSKVKDIVYHGTPDGNFDSFDVNAAGKITKTSTKGIYFTDSKKTATFYAEDSIDFSQFESREEYEAQKTDKVFSVILNATNLKLIDDPQAQEKQDDAILRTKNKLSDIGLTGYTPDLAHQYIVFEPKQIHILGNNHDLEGFKKFQKEVPNQPIITVEQSNQKVDTFINTIKQSEITVTNDDIVAYMNKNIGKTYLNSSGFAGYDKIIFSFNDRDDSIGFIAELIKKERNGYRVITEKYNVLVDFDLVNIIQTTSKQTGKSFSDKSGSNGTIELPSNITERVKKELESNIVNNKDESQENSCVTPF